MKGDVRLHLMLPRAILLECVLVALLLRSVCAGSAGVAPGDATSPLGNPPRSLAGTACVAAASTPLLAPALVSLSQNCGVAVRTVHTHEQAAQQLADQTVDVVMGVFPGTSLPCSHTGTTSVGVMALSALVVAYNLPLPPESRRLTRSVDVLSSILNGSVTSWDAPVLTALNPDLARSNIFTTTPITLVGNEEQVRDVGRRRPRFPQTVTCFHFHLYLVACARIPH